VVQNMTKKPDLPVVDPDATGSSPPRKLGQHGLALWNSIVGGYRIDDAGGREVLCQICLAQDRVEALAERISVEGETIATRTGVRVHPAIRDERQGRAFIVKALEKLGIATEAVKPMGRPVKPTSWTR
jgi:hypothetical protein